jgi:hypothetical protein
MIERRKQMFIVFPAHLGQGVAGKDHEDLDQEARLDQIAILNGPRSCQHSLAPRLRKAALSRRLSGIAAHAPQERSVKMVR